jgi:hypothetical protein
MQWPASRGQLLYATQALARRYRGMSTTEGQKARVRSPYLLASRQALDFVRPLRPKLEDYQARVAHLAAVAARGRVRPEEVEVQARLLRAEIDNTRHAFRTELQNMPASIRRAGPVNDALRGLDSAHERAKRIVSGTASVL